MQKQKRPNGTIVFELSPDAKQKNMHDDRVDCVAMMCNHLMELRAQEVLALEEKPKTEFKEMFAKQKSLITVLITFAIGSPPFLSH